ncbi:hypothetical protein AB1Y20_015910 [Prymnesium parvum]|uniref:Uncharacterized protein n=1 Tax=Prymnesium parvum TaxID=97485 RepID=A0AB34K1T5_PRYPA|mmetsp:Transcript_23542/g.58438  ORF Transcript_23542/g.58438 Transcript_23542/m.58438 type:complete len:165 (+) Transcript_23542:86-580(+)
MATCELHPVMRVFPSVPDIVSTDAVSDFLAAEVLTNMFRGVHPRTSAASNSPDFTRSQSMKRSSPPISDDVGHNAHDTSRRRLSEPPVFSQIGVYLRDCQPSVGIKAMMSSGTKEGCTTPSGDEVSTPSSPTDVMHVPEPLSPSTSARRPAIRCKAFLPSLSLL